MEDSLAQGMIELRIFSDQGLVRRPQPYTRFVGLMNFGNDSCSVWPKKQGNIGFSAAPLELNHNSYEHLTKALIMSKLSGLPEIGVPPNHPFSWDFPL